MLLLGSTPSQVSLTLPEWQLGPYFVITPAPHSAPSRWLPCSSLNTKQAPASCLRSTVPLPRISFPKISIWFPPSLPTSLWRNILSVGPALIIPHKPPASIKPFLRTPCFLFFSPQYLCIICLLTCLHIIYFPQLQEKLCEGRGTV